MHKIAVIGINYKSDDSAVRFVRSVSSLVLEDIELTVIVVDNTVRESSDFLFNRIWAINKDAVCIKAQINLGYFGGARIGLQNYLDTYSKYPDWLIVSNVDIVIQDKNFMKTLCSQRNKIVNVGIIAPMIWSNLTKRNLNPKMFYRPSKHKMLFLSVMFSNYFTVNFYMFFHYLKTKMLFWFNVKKSNSILCDPSYIYAAHGSFIVFSKLYFMRGGSLNYSQFLFNEEVFLAETALSTGVKILYLPKLVVFDDEHISTGIFRSRLIASYMKKSAKFVFKEYFA